MDDAGAGAAGVPRGGPEGGEDIVQEQGSNLWSRVPHVAPGDKVLEEG
jgi:hypothetical protein